MEVTQTASTRSRVLVSPNLFCRWFGCKDYVPSSGYYPGMPQAHCYYCGKITGCAADFCQDFQEPAKKSILGFWLARQIDKLKTK